MSVISFGPNQQLTAQQKAAYRASQQLKQKVWDTSHRLAALNNVPGVDDPANGDNVDIRGAVPLPEAHPQSQHKFDALATGSVHRDQSGQMEKAEVHAQLADGNQWTMTYQHQGDTLAYSAPAPNGQGQLHVVENLSNGTISMLEAPQLVPDFVQQLQDFTPPAAAPAPSAPPAAAGWNSQNTGAGLLDQAGGFFKKLMGSTREPAKTEAEQPVVPQKSISEYAQEGKARAVEAVQSEGGRKWGKLLIGSVGMGFLDKALAPEQGATEPPAEPKQA